MVPNLSTRVRCIRLIAKIKKIQGFTKWIGGVLTRQSQYKISPPTVKSRWSAFNFHKVMYTAQFVHGFRILFYNILCRLWTLSHIILYNINMYQNRKSKRVIYRPPESGKNIDKRITLYIGTAHYLYSVGFCCVFCGALEQRYIILYFMTGAYLIIIRYHIPHHTYLYGRTI